MANNGEEITCTDNDNEDYSDWDPLLDMANSVYNLDGYGSSVGPLGTPVREGFYCKFPIIKGTNYCWKKHNCVRPHRIINNQNDRLDDIPEDEDIPKDESTHVQVQLSFGIPPQRTCAQGVSFMAKMVHVVSPEEFYLIPEQILGCLCGSSEYKYASIRNSGISSYEDMMTDIQLVLAKRTRQTNYYSLNEVVVCKTQLEGTKSPKWYRAVVVKATGDEEVHSHGTNRPGLATVQVMLMDVGIVITTTTLQLAYLRPPFCTIPPHAYKCSLHGIIPICDIWSSKANELFKSLVQHQRVFVEVKRTSFSDSFVGIFNDDPYQVSLRLPNNGWKCVELELVKIGQAVALNPWVSTFRRAVQLQKRALTNNQTSDSAEEEASIGATPM